MRHRQRWLGGQETTMADAVAGKVMPPDEQQLKKGVLKHVVVPLIAVAAYALGIWGSIVGSPVAPFTAMAPITGLWLLLGIGVVFYLRAKSPELVGRLGQALGEEGGSEAEAGLA
jgi:hypothetical protein